MCVGVCVCVIIHALTTGGGRAAACVFSSDRPSAEHLLSSLKSLRCTSVGALRRERTTVREPPRSPLDAERMLRSHRLDAGKEEAQEEEELVASFRRLNRTGSA